MLSRMEAERFKAGRLRCGHIGLWRSLSSVRSATVTEPRSSLPQTQKEQAGVNAGQNLTPKKNKAVGNAGLVFFDAVRSPLQERIAVNVAGLSMMILPPC
jgi:hypothetical protein